MALFALHLPAEQPVREPLPKFEEVYDLLRSNLKTLTETELDEAAVRGLLAQLDTKVILVTNGAPAKAGAGPAISKTAVYEKNFAYIRIEHIKPDLKESLAKEWSELARKHMKGLVLDLRFAAGTNYAAAAAAADLFADTEKLLLDWTTGSARSTGKTDAISVPVTVLVNRETAGAAEALAAILRDQRIALIVGATTAGMASRFEEFILKNGQRLHVATTPIKLGSGEVIPPRGLEPDIQVHVAAGDERRFLEDPYREMTVEGEKKTTATGVPRRRTNEADLVRMHREGLSPDDLAPEIALGDGPLLIRDPALARAVDLLKGLAVVQQSRRM